MPESEWEEFEATMRSTLPISFRLTGTASEASVASLRSYMKQAHVGSVLSAGGRKLEPIAWYPNEMAWRFDVSRAELRGKGPANPSDAPADGSDSREPSLVRFHQFLKREGDLGSLSRQEEVSMVAAASLREPARCALLHTSRMPPARRSAARTRRAGEARAVQTCGFLAGVSRVLFAPLRSPCCLSAP